MFLRGNMWKVFTVTTTHKQNVDAHDFFYLNYKKLT